MNREEANRENIKRWHDEISLFNTLPSIDSLRLKRVYLQSKDRNDHRHTGITPNKFYLVCEKGSWFMGKFSFNSFTKSWEIEHGWTRSGIGHLDIIYEMEDLPEIPKHLIERLPLPPEEEDEEDCEE